MTNLTARVISAAAVSLCAVASAWASGPEPIRALLITGHNNHNWQYTSRMHADTLRATTRFAVDITDDPATALADASNLSTYQVFILDYNDDHAPKRWGNSAEKNFVEAVRKGTGVVAIHSANNAFRGWKEYESMIGLMWREGASHGKFHEFSVEPVDGNHPVTSGLKAWSTPDELYHGLTNPQNSPYKLLAQAMSSKESGGTGKNEPMALALSFGEGRILATPLGHVWVNSDSSKPSISNAGFKTLLVRGAEWAATGSVTIDAWSDQRAHNMLTDAERADGWKLLFDGSVPLFRSFKKTAMPSQGWVVKNGELIHETNGRGGDIVTLDRYANFEFACEWNVAEGGNSGIMYHCSEEFNYPWETGPECQILDDARHADGKKPKTRAGTLYDLVPTALDVSRPAGEWNSARIVIQGTRIQHFLNGWKVVDIDTTSEEFAAAYKQSKWPGMKNFNTKATGHIALQDHGDLVRFRNIKVRELK
jgi:type 1 glutamine amidotransferase